jgi:hypothetical protein
MRKGEYLKNESLETTSSHFLLEMRQLVLAISRENGKLKKEEIIRDLADYMTRHVSTDKLPKVLVAEQASPSQPASEYVKDFTGSLEKKAEKLFDFLVKERTLNPVTVDFPEKKRSEISQRHSSGFFIHEAIQKRVLNKLGYTEPDKKEE